MVRRRMRHPSMLASWGTARRRIALFVMAMTCLAVGTPCAEPPRTAEIDALTAAYLVKFIDFVTWPPEDGASDSEVRIGLVGASHLKPMFRGAEGRPLASKGGRLAVEDLGGYREDLDLTGFAVLFIGSSEAPALRDILEHVRGQSVLLVSDIEGFVDGGGMIGLRIHDRRLRWDLGLGTMRAAGLDPSSQLIRAALRVNTEPAAIEGAP
jgi:hypothetical protein